MQAWLAFYKSRRLDTLQFHTTTPYFDLEPYGSINIASSTFITWRKSRSHIYEFQTKNAMKKILHFLLLLLLPVCVNAQNQLKQTKIHAENVQLRLPESTVFDSISIEVPDSGKVTVIFDGNCTSTVDDRIILA